MKRTWKTASALSTALCLLVVTQAMGQITQPRNPGKALQRGAAEREAATGQKFSLASKLTKMTVKDSANQSIGQIQDLLIDDSGQVEYVAIAIQDAAATDRLQPRTPGARPDQPGARSDQPAVRPQPGATTRGELAGAQVGKVTLVPFEAVQFHQGDAEAQAYVILSIDKDRFTQAPTFTVQQLTTQGQQTQWMSQVNQFFEREKSGAARPDLNGQPNRNDPNRPNRNNPNNPNRPDRNDLDRDDQPRIERNDDQPRIERSDEQPKRDE